MSAGMFIWVKIDTRQDRALISGRGVRDLLTDAGLGCRWTWSRAGRAYVVGMRDLPDVVALAEYRGAIVRFREVSA